MARCVRPLLILACLLAGCGGGGDAGRAAERAPSTPAPSATPSPAAAVDALSHSEFVRKLNKTCSGDAAGAKRINVKFQDQMGSGDYAGAAASLRDLIDLATPYWEQQRELDAPQEDAETFASYMDTQRQFQGVMRRLVTAVREQDVERINFLVDALGDIRQARLKVASALGADACGG